MSVKRYTQEFKDEAVRLIIEKGLNMSHVSRDLDVDLNTLWRWKKVYCAQHNISFNTQEEEQPKSLQAQIAALERENRRLLLERDILKKAVSIF